MKVIVFGVGNYYHEQKNKLKKFEDIEIVACADNNMSLWNKSIDGIVVIPPESIQNQSYDKVIIMSVYVCPIYEQLLLAGVQEKNIIIWECLYKERMLKNTSRLLPVMRSDDSTSRNILIVSQELTYDGGAWAAIYAAIVLKRRGISVILSVPGGNEKLLKEVRACGVSVAIDPVLPYIYEEQKEWLRQFDAVIVNLFTMVQTAYEISKICPVLWWIHEPTQIYEEIRTKFAACLHLRRESRLNIYAVSHKAQKIFNDNFAIMINKILPLGIPDMTALYHIREKRNKKIVFAIIGAICKLKAQDIFVQAAMTMAEDTNIEFWIIGRSIDDEYYRKIKNMVVCTDAVRVLGELTREDLNNIFPEIDVCVCASQEETLSITIIEAMMYGKICIATENTGIAEYIQNGINGFVIPCNDIEALAEKMQWIIEYRNKAEEMGKAARNTYERCFTMDIFGENLENALDETTAEWKN